jgi:hypothetical protein
MLDCLTAGVAEYRIKVMTTLTLNKNITLRKTNFKDLQELHDFIDLEFGHDCKQIDLKPLAKKEVTAALKKKLAEVKKLSKSRFVNLSQDNAHR